MLSRVYSQSKYEEEQSTYSIQDWLIFVAGWLRDQEDLLLSIVMGYSAEGQGVNPRL